MKNKLTDLNDHLFAQLERLGDEDLTPEQLTQECSRAEAIVRVSDKIITNAALQVKSAELIAEYGDWIRPNLPPAKQIEHDSQAKVGQLNGARPN